MYLASQRPVSRLVLVTPFDSVLEVAARSFWFVPVRWLLRDKFESVKYAPDITAPTTIIAAEHDVEIPRRHTEALLRALSARHRHPEGRRWRRPQHHRQQPGIRALSGTQP